MTAFHQIFPQPKPLIGVVHLPPMPGYPESPGIRGLLDAALADLRACEAGGLDGAMMENEHDRPHRLLATPEVTAAMTRITRAACREARRCVVGCEILLNDPQASLAVAMAAGGRFIRTDYFTDPMTRDGWGEMAIDAPGLLACRRRIRADDVLILADIQVKYARMMVPRTLAESARLAREAGADAVIVTGDATGDAPTPAMLEAAADGAGELPVLVGSGLDPDNARELLARCDGAIVGTALMRGQRVDAALARALVAIRDAVVDGS